VGVTPLKRLLNQQTITLKGGLPETGLGEIMRLTSPDEER
jgi:hypothetical protein